jgi:hypothetical protein
METPVMRCPCCGFPNPPFDFVVGAGRNLQMSVQYVTVVCKAERKWREELLPQPKEWDPICRAILSVAILALEVTPGLV